MHILDMDVQESLNSLEPGIDKLALIADDRLRKELESIDFIYKMLNEAYKRGVEHADGNPDHYDY